MAYGDPRAFAAQSMLQPLQRHTPAPTRNRFTDFLSTGGGAALQAGAGQLGGMGGEALGGMLGLNNPALMKAAQGGGGVDADRAWVQANWGKLGK